MIPVLYRADGSCAGALADCTRCYVTQERNGAYEAEIDYPMTSPLFREIDNGCYIMAKPDDRMPPQKMRVYGNQKPLYGIATFCCEHRRYALNDVPVAPGHYTGTPALILEQMAASVEGISEFTFWSDISAVKTIDVTVPTTLGKLMAGQEGSVLDRFGGEYAFDNETVRLYRSRGQERSAEIRYAKNLTGFTCETDSSRTYTHIYPFYYNETDNSYVELTGRTIELSGASSLPFRRCYMLDLSAEWESAPTQAQLESTAQAFISANEPDKISYRYRVSFVPLWQTEQYKDVSALERCGLCDTVPIIHNGIGERVKAKIIRTVYDSLSERYVEIELGNAVSTFAETVVQNIQQINSRIQHTKSFLQQVVSRQTALITGNRGGYVVLYDSNGDGEPDEILIMDTPSILTAVHVWRWNVSGLGYSNHGYAGPYETAITMDGSINASFITSGTLIADLIKSGIISDAAGNVSVDMTNGTFTMKQTNGTSMQLWRNGLTFYGQNGDVLASMFISVGGAGVTTANRIMVGIRDSERTDIGTDANGNGYIHTDSINATGRIMVGIRDSERTDIGTDANGKGYIHTDNINATGRINVGDIWADSIWIKDSNGVPVDVASYSSGGHLRLRAEEVYTGCLHINDGSITGSGNYAPVSVTINGTAYMILCKQ